ncbi:hypothetical protein CPG37_06685 [Malaciobacter canalis]|uniref:Abi-like protein n=1 Tax=Malaciobacter canalis TaxID=1912871 RepID=A0ABX4LPZ5_9BACT|nr:hypothetical protein [Malaciobacter canalis]PHO10021.1 hypothetical protein CPG37_06685 [Malaciobacter canalis]QEE33682.1 hypothetical protein ACAN_2232 [Malaciobacter canalis]
MNNEFYKNLEKSVSNERLSHYFTIFQTEDKKIIIRKYLLNIELSKSFYLPLQKLETTLRNNIHTTLSNQLKNDNWFEISDFLTNDSYKKISEAKNNINKELTPGRIISELNFGFWCALFSKPYDQKVWNKYTKLIFPNIPRKYATRKVLMKKTNLIRKFRNKIFHFDTIINIKNLFEIHKEILEMIYWLNKDVYKLTIAFDEFEYIYNNEEKIIKEKLDELSKDNQ